MNSILCVEDGADTVHILKATLKDYNVSYASTLKEAEALLSKNKYDLLLLDIELPDGNTLDLMSEKAEIWGNPPVMFITGRADFPSKAAAFALGADDFIVKPFDPKDVRLRVDAKMRKINAGAGQRNHLQIGSLHCRLDEQRLFKGDSQEPIDLTSIEFRIFALLARTPNKIFSRAELLERVWGPAVNVSDRAVDVHISNLRKKLEGSNVTIDAVIGSGYRVLVTKQ